MIFLTTKRGRHLFFCRKTILVSNGFVSSKIYDRRDDFDFDNVNFPFLDGDVKRCPFYGVYTSQIKRFASVCSHIDAFKWSPISKALTCM